MAWDGVKVINKAVVSYVKSVRCNEVVWDSQSMSRTLARLLEVKVMAGCSDAPEQECSS